MSAGRVHNRRVEKHACADAHSLDCLSICPRSFIVCTGQLEGLCSAAECTGAGGGSKQQADPCDTLALKQFKQEASLAESASLAAAGVMSSLSVLLARLAFLIRGRWRARLARSAHSP